ncbi:MAG: hypothetical protein ISF22_08725 [Methanomassiliicoccus sp.]|nr:hypothetical protein [Methanomassiliicoccus sp.]
MRFPTPMQSFSLLGVFAILLAIPLFVLGVLIGRLRRDPVPKKFSGYVLLPPKELDS